MHVRTYNFAEVAANIREIQERIIDALFHVRDSEGVSSLLVSVFLPDGQCHLLVDVDRETGHQCRVTIVKQTPEAAEVTRRLPTKDFDETVHYLEHIVLEFDRRRPVSNLVVTTDGRRVRDVTSRLDRPQP